MMIEAEASDETVLVEWGARLARVRLRKNLTQAQVAELAGVSKRTVERWESGRGAPQITTLLAVCRVLGLSGRFDAWIPEADEGGGLPEQRAPGRGRKRRRAVGASSEPQKTAGPASGLSVPGSTAAERCAADFVVVANQID
jgi:transcriptional regulator with XRE-family HTH domain